MSARTCRAFALAILTAGCGTDSTGPRLPVAAIELAAVGNVWVGDVRGLPVTLRASDGSTLVGRTITWSSSNENVAVVHASGELTALAVGTTTITARSEGKQGEIVVVVSDLDLLYEGFLSGTSEMFVLALAGGQPTRVLPAGVIVTAPVASPNGTRIAFVATETGSAGSDIYVVNRDGTNLVKLTSAPEPDDSPSWSPDGTRIAFRSYRTRRFGDIWVMNADGSSPVNLTPDPLPDTTDERKPAWSPDGNRIAFSSNRGGNFDIWIMRSDGTELRQLTSTLEYDTEPTWSPDGRIAFRRSDDLTSDVMVINAQGGTTRRVARPGHELMPSWSPNGSFIAFAHFAPSGGPPQIYTMRPDGSALTLRTTEPAWNGGIEPSWVRK